MLKKFIINVLVGLAALACSATFGQAQTRSPQQLHHVTVNVTERGYRPSSVRLKKGVRTRLTFVRRTDATCGQVVVIPAYGIRRDLPLNQPVSLTLTPRRSGTFGFTCGMNMMRGTIIVN